MVKKSFKLLDKASVSLSTIIRREANNMPPISAATAVGLLNESPGPVAAEDKVFVLLETHSADTTMEQSAALSPGESLVQLSESVLSGELFVSTAREMLGNNDVRRIQTKKSYQLHLDAAATDIELVRADGSRLVEETGKGVLIGIVDSGFDLSHPMFRDANGNLRVEGLLDQTTAIPQEFTQQQLETGWQNGTNPGADFNGHGTHVSSIAGGTKFGAFEGIAPGARFLLVKTNFRDTADGVSWIFSQASNQPCVINMSLGTHFGSHDGSSAEELLIDQLSGPGKIVVVSAGNERQGRLHIGGRFLPNQIETVGFDVPAAAPGRRPLGIMTVWHDPQDSFALTLITPTGQEMVVPSAGNIDTFSSAALDIEIGRNRYAPTNLIQVQITLAFRSQNPPAQLLNGWRLRIACQQAVIGRLDAWFANSGFGKFRSHSLIEESRTVGMAATARSCIAVASHVSKNIWSSDDDPQQDLSALVGRSSTFSSRGPTRDGRQKPDISAPGQLLTAALAANSELGTLASRALANERLLTIEGTSMAAPVITGVVALLLQKKGTLTPDQVRAALAASAKTDAHVGTIGWNPSFGHGKVVVRRAVDEI